MNIESIKSIYSAYANVYDYVFGPILHPGRKRVVQVLNARPGERVLEVGVGTGLSLPLYPRHARITGIDISREMLVTARKRVVREKLSHVDAVLEMDGEAMTFTDNHFDKVAAMYVVSVAPDPRRLLSEICRVCKPGGEIFIVNHFRSRHPVVRFSEDVLSPLSRRAGFRSDMDLEDFLADTALEVREVQGVNLFGYWKVLRCLNGAKDETPSYGTVKPLQAEGNHGKRTRHLGRGDVGSATLDERLPRRTGL